jgi:hypothetical protein
MGRADGRQADAWLTYGWSTKAMCQRPKIPTKNIHESGWVTPKCRPPRSHPGPPQKRINFLDVYFLKNQQSVNHGWANMQMDQQTDKPMGRWAAGHGRQRTCLQAHGFRHRYGASALSERLVSRALAETLFVIRARSEYPPTILLIYGTSG